MINSNCKAILWYTNFEKLNMAKNVHQLHTALAFTVVLAMLYVWSADCTNKRNSQKIARLWKHSTR